MTPSKLKNAWKIVLNFLRVLIAAFASLPAIYLISNKRSKFWTWKKITLDVKFFFCKWLCILCLAQRLSRTSKTNYKIHWAWATKLPGFLIVLDQNYIKKNQKFDSILPSQWNWLKERYKMLKWTQKCVNSIKNGQIKFSLDLINSFFIFKLTIGPF